MSFPRLSYNNKQKILVADSETEGLSLVRHRPWEIAYSLTQGNKVIESKVLYPWFPDLKVGKRAAEVTGFSFEKYRDLSTPKEDVWEELKSYLYDPNILICGHNFIGFDIFMIRNLALACKDWPGWEGFIEKVIDTLCLSRMYHNGDKPDPNNFLASQLKEIGKPKRGSPKANLAAMAKCFNIEVDETKTHSGKYDTFLTSLVLNKLIYALDI